MNYQLLERPTKPESSLPGLRQKEPKFAPPPAAKAAPAPAPAPSPAEDAPAKRKPGRPRKVVA
jgi:hypothetical protein